TNHSGAETQRMQREDLRKLSVHSLCLCTTIAPISLPVANLAAPLPTRDAGAHPEPRFVAWVGCLALRAHARHWGCVAAVHPFNGSKRPPTNSIPTFINRDKVDSRMRRLGRAVTPWLVFRSITSQTSIRHNPRSGGNPIE